MSVEFIMGGILLGIPCLVIGYLTAGDKYLVGYKAGNETGYKEGMADGYRQGSREAKEGRKL